MGDIFSLNETQSRILKALLLHEKKLSDCKLRGVTSYSLSKNEPKIPIATWNDHYRILEEMKLIRKQVLKKNDGRGTKPYSITPLGIAVFSRTIKIDKELLLRILEILKCQYQVSKSKDEKSYLSIFEEALQNLLVMYKLDYLVEMFKKIVDNVKVRNTTPRKDEDKSIQIALEYETEISMKINMMTFDSHKDHYHLFFYPEEQALKLKEKKISEKQADYFISKFIFMAYFHFLALDNHFWIGYFSTMPKHKKTYKELKDVFQKYPKEVLDIVRDFNSMLLKSINIHSLLIKQLDDEISKMMNTTKK